MCPSLFPKITVGSFLTIGAKRPYLGTPECHWERGMDIFYWRIGRTPHLLSLSTVVPTGAGLTKLPTESFCGVQQFNAPVPRPSKSEFVAISHWHSKINFVQFTVVPTHV